jgi:hypothetical protein
MSDIYCYQGFVALYAGVVYNPDLALNLCVPLNVIRTKQQQISHLKKLK